MKTLIKVTLGALMTGAVMLSAGIARERHAATAPPDHSIARDAATAQQAAGHAIDQRIELDVLRELRAGR